MNLDRLIKNIELNDKINYDGNIDIKGISYNSNKISKGDIFVCMRGEHVDGHNFAADAVEKGAVAIMAETKLDINVPQIIVASTEQSLAPLADNFYQSPSKDINT